MTVFNANSKPLFCTLEIVTKTYHDIWASYFN